MSMVEYLLLYELLFQSRVFFAKIGETRTPLEKQDEAPSWNDQQPPASA